MFNIFSLRVPPFLASIDDPRAARGGSLIGCPMCGGEPLTFDICLVSFSIIFLGLGHGISNCPKLEETQRRQLAAHRTVDTGGAY